MTSDLDPRTIANTLLLPLNLQATTIQPIQSLWAGYGQICRLTITPTAPNKAQSHPDTLILKLVTPPTTTSSTPSESHLRKLISYQVEHHFYTALAPQLRSSRIPVPVASCLASTSTSVSDPGAGGVALILTDLREQFAEAGEKRGVLGAEQVAAAVRWLAGFHGFWWGRGMGKESREREGLRRAPLEEAERGLETRGGEGGGAVWLNGGYTYLATRRSEYASLAADTSSEWSRRLCETGPGHGLSTAELAARFLAPSPSGVSASPIAAYETLIHGDVKSENLFTSAAISTPAAAFPSSTIAFFDFQYTGLGLGVSDLAKLFTCSVPEDQLTSTHVQGGEKRGMDDGERGILEMYLTVLREASGKEYEWEVFERHWETALVDWLRFQASWGFWGNTEWLEARARDILEDGRWEQWIEGQLAGVPAYAEG